MIKYLQHLFDCYRLLALAKKYQMGKSERGDLKKWEYCLARASFTPGGYYYSERVKNDFLKYIEQHHPYVKDYEKFFMKEEAIKFAIRSDQKLRKILLNYQGRKF